MKKSTRGPRAAVHALVVLGLLATSGYLTLEMRQRERDRRPGLAAVAAAPRPERSPQRRALTGTGYRYERLGKPARTVVRYADGSVVATFTDGARTAVLSGPSRTFAEPRTTKAKVVTDSWVRLLPKAWSRGSERSAWFRDWFERNECSTAPDILELAMSYLDRAPARKDRAGVRYAGDARFGSGGADFHDYLGVPWSSADGVRPADKAGYGAVDSAGYLRLVYGYRAGYPMRGRDGAPGRGLPRTATAMAFEGPGLPVIEHRDARPASIDVLQPGDLVFFEVRSRTGVRPEHAGIYLGLDTDGHPRFISSRAEAEGPTFGDLGGSSRLDGGGLYGKGLRGARRL